MRWLFNLYLLSAVVFNLNLRGQDTLYFNSKNKLTVQLLEINPENLKYKRSDNLTGPIYTINKSEISHVVYKNGVKESFETKLPEKPKETETSKSEDGKGKTEDFFAGDKADTIYFLSGKRTAAKILIISTNDVKYKLFDFQDGPTYTAGKSELKGIHKGNGQYVKIEEEIREPDNKSPQTKADEGSSYDHSRDHDQKNDYSQYSAFTGYSYGFNQRLYDKGKADAKRFYRHNGGAIGVGCAAAGCGPVIGLIPAVIVTDNDPKDINLGIPASAYSTHVDYLKGYREEAARMKKKRVWRGYGIGACVLPLIYIIAIIAMAGVI